MNYRAIMRNLSFLLYIEAVALAVPFGVALFTKDGAANAFIISSFVTATVGLIFGSLGKTRKKGEEVFIKDAFASVAIIWIFLSFFGALPFMILGVPVVDALFEAVSGFSTTGASIFRDAEVLPESVLFWRCFMNWLGGMGLLVLMTAIAPKTGRMGAYYLLEAEMPGKFDKIAPRIKQTSRFFYVLYSALTLVEFVLLKLGGLSAFDSVLAALATAGTGGFHNYNLSVGVFESAYVEGVITVFMLIFGVNFAVYFAVYAKKWKIIRGDTELKFYLCVFVATASFVAWNVYGNVYTTMAEAAGKAAFQAAALLTSTGFSTANFDSWPVASKCVLLFLMIMGGMTGSTAGGFKCARIVILLKTVRCEMQKLIHPRAVKVITMSGRALNESVSKETAVYFFLYTAIMAAAVFVVSFDGKDMVTTFSAVISAVGNVGPAFGDVNTAGSFANFSGVSKITLTLCMMLGRLEIYPTLLLFFPEFWKKV